MHFYDFQAIMTTTLLMLKAGLSSCAQWGLSLFTTAMWKCSAQNGLKTGFALPALMTLRPACYGQSTVISSQAHLNVCKSGACALHWAHVSSVVLVKDTQAMAWMLRKLLVAAVQRALLFFLHISLMLPNRPSSNGQTSAWYSQVWKFQLKYCGNTDAFAFCFFKWKFRSILLVSSTDQ